MLPTCLIALALQLQVAGEAPGPNLAPNPSFEEVGPDGAPIGWQLPEGYRVVTGAGHSGQRALLYENRDSDAYRLAVCEVPVETGCAYRISGWVRTEGVEGPETGATICLEWSGPDGWIGGCYPTGRKGDNDWFQVSERTQRIPPEATRVTLACYLRKGMTGKAWFDDVEVRRIWLPPLAAMLTEPNARGELPPTGPAKVSAYCEIDPLAGPDIEGHELVLRLEGRAPARSRKTLHAGDRDASLSVEVSADSSPTAASLELRAPSGDKRWSKRFPLHRARKALSDRGVYIDATGRTIVDGRPFFPLGLYFGGLDDADLDTVAKSPFNCVMPYGTLSGNVDDVGARLDAANARGLKVIFSVKDCYEGSTWATTAFGDWQGPEAVVRGAVRTFRDHPAALAWYVNDELSLDWLPSLERNFRWVAEEDPDHPTWAVLYQVDELFGYMGTCDVIGSDPYPIPDDSTFRAADWTRKSVAATHGARGVWMVPQAFDWGCYREDPAEKAAARAPTEAELRAMTYMCLCEGATGLVYYSFPDLKRSREPFEPQWERLCRVAAEVRDFAPIVLEGDRSGRLPSARLGAGVEAKWTQRAWRYGGKAYLMVAGAEEPLGEVTIGCAGYESCRALFTGREVQVHYGRAHDQLGSLAAEVYVLE